MHSESDVEEKVSLLKALADGTRLRIIQTLDEGPRKFAELKRVLNTTDGQIYYHLLCLGMHDIVRTERSDVTTYFITEKGRKMLRLVAALEKMRL